jgi:predicted nucleic acid-binding protein
LCFADGQVLQNPDDERILEVAVQSRAMIVTHNQKDFVGVEQFGVEVRTPAEFLRMSRAGQ